MTYILPISGFALAAVLVSVMLLIRLRRVQEQHQNATLAVRRLEGDLERATQRRARIETALSEAESRARVRLTRYDVLFNNAQDMVFFHGITENGLPGKFIEVNDVACEALERTREELLEMSPLDIEEVSKSNTMVRLYSRSELATISDAEVSYRRSTSDRQLVRQILANAEVHYERVYITGKGKRIPVEVRARRFDLDGVPLVLYTARDITERRKSERALREGQQRLHDMLAQSPLGSAMYDADCRPVDINISCLHMFGVPDEAAFERVNLFDNPFMSEETRKTLARKDGVQFEAVFDFDEVRRAGMFVSDRQGRAYFDVIMINLGLDSDFRSKGYVFLVQDITQRREAEFALREKEQQLRRSQKLEAIGSLASGIAHDFNNILTPIMGYTDLILESADGSESLHEYMSEVLKASHRAKDLVNQILTFSRHSDHEEVRLRITPIVKEVLKLTQTASKTPIKVQRALRASNDAVLANPVQIHQVLMNLCTNAAYAMRQTGGLLEVGTANLTVPRGPRTESGLEPGEYLRISVRDTGCGMDSATLERVFEPFFTTKGPGEGTGMGLAVVHGIISAMNGVIKVQSEVDKGSLFEVFLPTVPVVEEEEAAEESDLQHGSEQILVVDDEQAVLTMMSRMLTSLGYTVETALSPVAALQEVEQAPDRFDLLITDQMMPGMTGAELSARVLALRPDMPIVMCTGFSEDFTPRQGSELGIREFILKPVVVRNLAETVRRAIDAG